MPHIKNLFFFQVYEQMTSEEIDKMAISYPNSYPVSVKRLFITSTNFCLEEFFTICII